MSAKVVFFEELFVVVGHPNDVKLRDAVSTVYPCGVHVSMNKTLGVEVCQSRTQLSKDTKHFLGGKLLFAVRLPTSNMVRSLCPEQEGPVIVDEFVFLCDGEYVWVLKLGEFFSHLNGFYSFLPVESGDIDRGDQVDCFFFFVEV